MELYQLFYDPSGFFLRSLLVLSIPAVVFAFLFLKTKKKIVGTTALLWLLYVAYEVYTFQKFCLASTCNLIRVDLLLIWPVLALFSILSLSQGLPYIVKSILSFTKLPMSTKLLLFVVAVVCLAIGFFWGYNKRQNDVFKFKNALRSEVQEPMQDFQAPMVENKKRP